MLKRLKYKSRKSKAKKKQRDLIKQAIKAAFTIGLPLSDFWKATPWQLTVLIGAYHGDEDEAQDDKGIDEGDIKYRLQQLVKR